MGEIFGLNRDDVDFVNGRLTVQRQLNVFYKLMHATKTDASRRSVVLCQKTLVALREHKQLMIAEGNGGVESIFCGLSGNRVQRDNFRSTKWKPTLKRLGLPQIRFHDLRHTAATLLLQQGTHVKLVSEMLGHANINTTMDTYSHVLPTMHGEVATAFDTLLTV